MSLSLISLFGKKKEGTMAALPPRDFKPDGFTTSNDDMRGWGEVARGMNYHYRNVGATRI
jgi:hypothetical protein